MAGTLVKNPQACSASSATRLGMCRYFLVKNVVRTQRVIGIDSFRSKPQRQEQENRHNVIVMAFLVSRGVAYKSRASIPPDTPRCSLTQFFLRLQSSESVLLALAERSSTVLGNEKSLMLGPSGSSIYLILFRIN